MGKPRHEITEQNRQKVRLLVACGVRHEIIAEELGINERTLSRRYADELKHGAGRANGRVAQSLFATAVDRKHRNHVTAAIFWLKTRAGWKETQVVENTGRDGKPIEVDATVRVSGQLTDKIPQLQELIAQSGVVPDESGSGSDGGEPEDAGAGGA